MVKVTLKMCQNSIFFLPICAFLAKTGRFGLNFLQKQEIFLVFGGKQGDLRIFLRAGDSHKMAPKTGDSCSKLDALTCLAILEC